MHAACPSSESHKGRSVTPRPGEPRLGAQRPGFQACRMIDHRHLRRQLLGGTSAPLPWSLSAFHGKSLDSSNSSPRSGPQESRTQPQGPEAPVAGSQARHGSNKGQGVSSHPLLERDSPAQGTLPAPKLFAVALPTAPKAKPGNPRNRHLHWMPTCLGAWETPALTGGPLLAHLWASFQGY